MLVVAALLTMAPALPAQTTAPARHGRARVAKRTHPKAAVRRNRSTTAGVVRTKPRARTRAVKPAGKRGRPRVQYSKQKARNIA